MHSEKETADYIDYKLYLSESADIIEQISVTDDTLRTELTKVFQFLRETVQDLDRVQSPNWSSVPRLA